MCMCAHMCHVINAEIRRQLEALVPSFHCVGLRIGPRSSGLVAGVFTCQPRCVCGPTFLVHTGKYQNSRWRAALVSSCSCLSG